MFKPLVVLYAGACLCFASKVSAQEPFPKNAVMIVPTQSDIRFDRAALQIGEKRVVQKGGTIASFVIDQPMTVKLQKNEIVSLHGKSLELPSSSVLHPYSPGDRPFGKEGLVYCLNIGGKKKDRSFGQIFSKSSTDAKICFRDLDNDGFFEQAFFDAVFRDGVVPNLARISSEIAPLEYRANVQREGIAGPYEVMFRGFPIQSDKMTWALRPSGKKSQQNFGDVFLRSNNRHYRYYSPYFFVKFDKLQPSRARVFAMEITIFSVDRDTGKTEIRINKADDTSIFWPDYYDIVPEYRDFRDSED
jgi:hypothetical protein